jgi:hypothetical protein
VVVEVFYNGLTNCKLLPCDFDSETGVVASPHPALLKVLTNFFQSKTPLASLPQLAQGVIVQPCHPNLRLGYLSLCQKIVSEVATLE